MLTIEVNPVEQNGKVVYFHGVMIDDALTPDQAEMFDMSIAANRFVTLSFAAVHPGDDVYGATADYHQFLFWASEDLTAPFLEELWADMIHLAGQFAPID